MQLSESEKKLVERLRRHQHSLVRWRWVGLLGVFVYIAAGCYGVVVGEHVIKRGDLPGAMIVSFLIPTIYVLVGAGVGLGVYLILRWNGKPETHLLLRLIDESQNEDG